MVSPVEGRLATQLTVIVVEIHVVPLPSQLKILRLIEVTHVIIWELTGNDTRLVWLARRAASILLGTSGFADFSIVSCLMVRNVVRQ